MRTIKGCSCTAFIIGPTAGTTFRRGRQVPCGESSMWGDYHAPRGGPLRPAHHPRRALSDLLGRAPTMIIADLNAIEGRRYPARRRTQNLVGGMSPIQAANFAIGNVTLEPGRRAGAVAQPGAGRSLLCLRRHGRDVPGRRTAGGHRRPGRLHSARRLPPDDQHRRRRRCGCSTATARRATWPIGNRS